MSDFVKITDPARRAMFEGILDVDRVPILYRDRTRVLLEDLGVASVWFIDVQALTEDQLQRAARVLAAEKGARPEEALAQFHDRGWPIRCEVCERVRE